MKKKESSKNYRPFQISLVFHIFPVLVFILGSFVFKSAQYYFQDFEVYEFPEVRNAQTNPFLEPQKEIEKKIPQKRAIFGVSRDSILSDAPSSASVKAGNTVAQKEDTLTLTNDDARSLPIPTAEYLVTAMPRLLTEVRIPYPEESRKKGIEGPVVMELLIDSQGNVKKIDILSGPDQNLIQAALTAVERFRFSPARVNEENVAVKIRYEYAFKLE